MTKTGKIKTRIEKMEHDLAGAEAKTTELETALAAAYEKDGDIDAAHTALSAHRERTADMIGALRQLDARLEQVAEEERTTIEAEISAKVESNVATAQGEIEKAARAMGKVLHSHIGENSGPVVRQVIDLSTEACESAVLNWAGEERQRRLPDRYPVPKRDETGRVTYSTAYGQVFFRDFEFARTSNRDGLLVHTGMPIGATILDAVD